MSPGEPIDFDFSNQPPRHEPPASADGAEAAAQAEASVQAEAPVQAKPPPSVPAGTSITDFRTQSYPFATTSRFQQGGFSDPRTAGRASHGRRLTWGILAAVGAMLFAASVVVLMRVIDRSMNG